MSNTSLRFTIAGHTYRSRQLQEVLLYHPAGIIERDGMKVASQARAIADMLYVNPKTYFDAPIDWSVVQQLQIEIGYPLTLNRYADS